MGKGKNNYLTANIAIGEWKNRQMANSVEISNTSNDSGSRRRINYY